MNKKECFLLQHRVEIEGCGKRLVCANNEMRRDMSTSIASFTIFVVHYFLSNTVFVQDCLTHGAYQ